MENDTDYDLQYPDDDYYPPDDDHYRPETEDIVASVFFILGIFPILPALGWIILTLCRLRWDREHVTAFFMSLLFTDTLQLIVSPFIVETVLTGLPCLHASWWCITVYVLFSVSRYCGLFFHLLVALRKILSLSRPVNDLPQSVSEYLPKSISGSMILSFFVLFVYTIFSVIVHFVDIHFLAFYGINTIFGLVALSIAAAVCVIALKPLPKCDGLSLMVLAVAMFTFMILYVPEFLYCIIQYHRPAWTQGFSYVVHYLPCLRPITDCVLCWFVCRDKPTQDTREMTQENNTLMVISMMER